MIAIPPARPRRVAAGSCRRAALDAALLFCAAACAPPPEPPAPGALHLFDAAPSVVALPASRLPEELEAALAAERVWTRGEVIPDHAWVLEGTAEDLAGELRIRAQTSLPVAEPTRVVSWQEAWVPGAGRELADGERHEPQLGELCIGPQGVRTRIPGTHRHPPQMPLAFPVRSDVLRAERVGAFPSPEALAEPRRLVLHGESRRVALAPVPAHLAWELTLPPGAALSLGYGLRRLPVEAGRAGAVRLVAQPGPGAPGSARVKFHVRVRPLDAGAGAGETVWSGELDGARAGRFHDARVDLSAYAGRQVQLSLVTEPAAGVAPDLRFTPFWAEPVLDRTPADGRPHIVLVVVDTLRADVLGCYGGRPDLTPNLDALAAEGVRFDDAMCAATWTLPSHASILSSLYPTEHGVLSRERLAESVTTLAEALRKAGYHTRAVTEGVFLRPDFGLDQGFDVYETVGWDLDETLARGLGALEELQAPTFVFLHTYEVHAPYEPPAAYREAFVSDYSGTLGTQIPNESWFKIEGGADAADLRYVREMYAAEVAYTDAELGRFLTALGETGRHDDALVVITSDHGEAFDEHGVWGHGTSLYQEQLRVPLIVRQRGVWEGGAVVQRTVHGVDVAPTLAAAAGLAPPEQWSGQPLDTAAEDVTRPLFSAFRSLRLRKRATVVRDGPLKAFEFPLRERDGDPTSELRVYDLERDPLETADLSGDARDARWRALLGRLWESYGPVADPGQASFDAELQDDLEDLGYAGD